MEPDAQFDRDGEADVFRPVRILATWLLATVLAATWAAIVWLVVFAPAVIAIGGIVYAVGALGMCLESRSPDVETRFEKDAGDIRRQISAGGLRGLTFRLAQPLFHFAMLPGRSLAASIAMAAVLAVPWLVVR